ncbi:MAG: hypothetical protein ACREBR_04210 [bacterium]
MNRPVTVSSANGPKLTDSTASPSTADPSMMRKRRLAGKEGPFQGYFTLTLGCRDSVCAQLKVECIQKYRFNEAFDEYTCTCSNPCCSGSDKLSHFGSGSCVGFHSCISLINTTIGSNSCTDPTSEYNYACLSSVDSSVWNGSCRKDYACISLFKATIGDGSCVGAQSCADVSLTTVGNGSCKGYYSCAASPLGRATSAIRIGSNSCIGSSSCFAVNSGIAIGDNSCNCDGCCATANQNIGDNMCNSLADKCSGPII